MKGHLNNLKKILTSEFENSIKVNILVTFLRSNPEEAN